MPINSNITTGIDGASTLLSNSKYLLSLGLGVSLSEKEVSMRNNALLKSWHTTNYNIDSVSLSSPLYHIEPTGVITGDGKIGELTDVYSIEGKHGIRVEDHGGIVGYTNEQENADIDKKIVKDAKFKSEIINNNKFEQGASFINPSEYSLYNIDEKEKSLYATSSINATASTKTVKGAYKYNGGNEDLISRRVQNNTDVNDNYIMYNENARGNLTDPNQLLLTDDVESFMIDDSYSSSSLLLGEYEDTVKPKTLVMRTNELFRYGKIGSLVARFKTDSDFGATDWPSSKTAQHGMSRGRNLLKGKTEKINGYDNPYCRVWTNHYQYSKHNKLIRPFVGTDGISGINGSDLRKNLEGLNAYLSCSAQTNNLLAQYSVLEPNGHVRITPYKDETSGKYEDNKRIKRYMFSIENLAWKGYTDTLTDEQKGPNGGRIMWFPPYDLKFSENSHADWSPNKFIGRGEQIYTYSNTERGGNIEFSILVDHPSIVDAFVNHNSDATEKNEQTLLRFFAGCDEDILEPEPPKIMPKYCEEGTKGNPDNDEEERLKYFEMPESVYVVFPIFFQNNFTGVNYLNPEDNEYSNVVFKYTNESGKVVPCLFNTFYHTSNTYKEKVDGKYKATVKKITEPYFEGKTIKDAEKLILNEHEGYNLRYAGHETNIIGSINADSVNTAVSPRMSNRYKYETNGQSRLIGLDDAIKIMNSELDYGTDTSFISGKRHVYAQDAYRFQREAQPKTKEGYEGKRINCYSDVTYGLNTKIFSSYFNSNASELPDKENKNYSEFCPENGTKDFERVIKAYKMARGTLMFVSGNPNAKAISLEEMQNVNSIESLFKVLDIDYVTSAKTNSGDVVGINWECETIDAFGGASYSGNNNKSLANLRYLFVNEVLRKHNIDIKGFTTEFLEKYDSNNVQSDANMTIYGDTEKNTDLINAITCGYPGEVAGRLALIYFKLYPVADCGNGKKISEKTLNNGDKYYDSKTQKEYLLCSREVISKENQADEPKSELKLCGSECVYRHSAFKEYEYFRQIKLTDPLLFKNIVKKFQYFDPAFHSLTPEGFNARLTFLQQCTRQGPTKSTSDNGVVSTIGAGNLAFGAPPYVIIRIGDFFHTKAIIESLNITYEGNGSINWDLNPEGIGVQPMFAKISLNVKFLGGSDIAAPVARLQNAISSNYYANASIYDNTALSEATEQHEYDKSRNKILSKMHTFKDE